MPASVTLNYYGKTGYLSFDNISGTSRAIEFVLDSNVWFSGMLDQMELFPVGPDARWRIFKAYNP